MLGVVDLMYWISIDLYIKLKAAALGICRDQMVSKLYLLWVVFLLGGWGWCPCDACWDEEKTALLQFKPFFDYYIDGGLQNWVDGSDCCEWERVECNNTTQRVIRLSFNISTTEMATSGFVNTPPYVWEYERGQQYWFDYVSVLPWYLNLSLFHPFEQLQTLYLSGNSIAGFLDRQGSDDQKLLDKLETLDLSNNYFNDSTLESLSEFSSLKSLNLADNQLTGSNPSDGIKRLSKLKNLKSLDLQGNYMFGNNIVSNLANLTSLRSLYLQRCGLNGTLEMQELDNLINLEELYLSENAIESLGSSSFQAKKEGELRLNKVEVLDLSYNLFNNTIFSSLTSFSNLKSLNLSGNRLEGSIHIKEINALSSLEQLYMGDNSVNDFVPSQDNETDVRSKLTVLDLSGNVFNTSILASLATLSNLKSLTLNYLQGSIDLTELNALVSLEDLSLHCFPFADISCSLLLRSLGLFPGLKNLSLSGFSFQGTWMTSQNALRIFSNLEELMLENSILQTNFLGSIQHFTSLKRLKLASCEINGSLTLQDFCEMTNLQELDLSNNKLKADLPECFSYLASLEMLDLSSNQLSGNIFGLESLRSLEMLDLSSNHFSGNISVLESLTSLQTLDLSSNQFSGNINALKSLASLLELRLSNNNFQIPISLGPLFNLSKLKSLYADNNIVSVETQMHSLGAPAFQLKEMSLSCCGDVGSFPEFLYHQHDLHHLDLSNIFFKGTRFPYWLLENNTKLESLILTNTSLSGPVQTPLDAHVRLWYLDISNNFFNGSIPLNIGVQLPWLAFINMSDNHFIGRIPSFGDMLSLDTLDLSNNQLSGGIPEHLAMSPSLSVLILSDNKLEGNIFSENSYLPNLFELKLNGNNFSGWIPNILSKSPLLQTLDVSNNQLSGRIPWWMGNISHLEEIIMSNNHLQGGIPIVFCELGRLRILDLSVNNISGTLPSCLSPSWTQINLSKNRLRGTIPNALRTSSTLVTLDISDNFLIGSIPSWIGELSTLSYLLLSNNFFHGEIPMELCILNQLSLINLSHNNLSGRIPPCLKITTLEDVPVPEGSYVESSISPAYYIAPSQFSLNEPIDFPIKNVSNSYKGKIIALVSGIDLSCNKLVGEIPYEFGNFYKILVLNLSHNSLIGPIPPTFANLKQIESLDLSYNKLSGSIPPQLVGLNFLAYFVVSFNNLSGKTPPRSAQFGTFDESSYRGNPFLCGEPLPKCGETGPMSNSLTDSDEDDDLMDMGVFRVSFVMSYMVLLLTVVVVLYINPYWRRAWFFHVETTASTCYYFVLDNVLPRRFHY